MKINQNLRSQPNMSVTKFTAISTNKITYDEIKALFQKYPPLKDNVKTELDPSKAVSTTITSLFNNYSFKDDSYNKVSKTYFNNKMNIYKVNAYVNHAEVSGKLYITLSDVDYTPSDLNNAYSHYQVPINNDGYWNTTYNSFSYHNLYSYENSGEPIDVYIALYQENHVSVDPIKNKAVWKVYLFEELVPEYLGD